MGNLLHAEWYKLLHDRIFWVTSAVVILLNVIIFSGNSILNRSGLQALKISMTKEIISAMIACIYGGLFIGGDFIDRTFYHGLMAGKSRSFALWAKLIVFAVATDVLLFLYPFLYVLVCTIKNGWGETASAGLILHMVSIVAALLVLGFAISTVSLLAAVCFRDVGRTIGIPIVLYFAVIVLLNSTCSSTFFRIFPISTLILVTDSTVSPAYGIGLGIVWMGLLSVASILIFRRTELR